jgi:hypothetical protein
MNVTALRNIYQLKIALDGAKPPIWRRVLVPSSYDLADLHDVIQITMGWMDCHMHQFVIDGEFYGVPEPEFDFDVKPEAGVRLSSVFKGEKDKIHYEYDFGDGWSHTITLEKILPFTPEKTLPYCVTGRKACPPEDVGGIWGYANLLAAWNDPEHPEHQSYRDWLADMDEEFDPDVFDRETVNAMLSEWAGS